MPQPRTITPQDSARRLNLRELGLLDTPAEPDFDRLTRLASQFLDVPVALIALIDADQQFFKSCVGLPALWVSPGGMPLGDSFCRRVIDAGTAVGVADRNADNLHDDTAIFGSNAVALAGIPLITSTSQALGVFCVADTKARAWTEGEIAALADLGAAALAAIELRAERAARERAEAEALRLSEQRKELLEIAGSMFGTLTLDDVLRWLQHALHNVLAYHSFGVYWLDQDAETLRPALTDRTAWIDQAIADWSIPLDRGIAGGVARSGRAELVNDAHLDPRSVYPAGASVAREHVIAVPIQFEGRTQGVIIISRNSGPPFSESDFDLAQLFIGYVALAIENARLFRQTKIAEEQQRLLIEQLPTSLWTTDRDLRVTSAAGSALTSLGLQPDKLIGRTLYELFGTSDPEHPAIVNYHRALAGEPVAYEVAWSGHSFQVHVDPFHDAQGQIVGVIASALDITERVRTTELQVRQRRFFEQLATGQPIATVLGTLVELIEAQIEGGLCSILLLDRERKRLTHSSAPSLPASYVGAIDGASIGPAAGSCGTAAFRDEMVIVEDIATDPLWESWRDVALAHDLRACWSTPFHDSQGAILGTFAIYYRDPRAPSAAELEQVVSAANLAAVAVERRGIEAALHASQSLLQNIIDYSPATIVVQDLAEGRYLLANSRIAQAAGISREQVIGKRLADLYPPELVAAWRAQDQRIAATGEPLQVEDDIRRADGTLHTSLGIKFPLYSEQGSIYAIGGIFTDISERKRAEVALRESEERFRTLIRDLRVGVLVQGPRAEIILSNQAALDLLGLSEAQLLGKTSFDPDWNVIHEDGAPFSGPTHPVPQAIATRMPVRDVVMGVYRPTKRDRVWLLVSAEPQLNEDGAIRQVICTFNDITARKHADEERERLIRALKEALANVRTLRGLLPICASCKKIRDDRGYWNQLEIYIQEHSEAGFTHGICPDCVKRLYGDLYDE